MHRFLFLTTIILINLTVGHAAIPMVDNPQEAPASRTVNYEELWRVGADDEAEFIFGVIMGVVEDEDGNLYLLDTQQQQVFKFSASGEYQGLVSRRGEGPGEIEMVYQMRYLGGGELGLLKVVPSSLVKVDTDGLPLPSVTFKITSPEQEIRFGGLYSFEAGQNTIYGTGQFHLADISEGVTLSYLASYDTAGQEIHRFGEWYGGYDFEKPIKVNELSSYHPLNVWDTDGAGLLYHTVARDSFLVEVRNRDGGLVRRISRPWETHKRTKAEKEVVKGQYGFSSNRDLPPISYNIADTDPALVDIKIVGDELWLFNPVDVRRGRAQESMIADVFDLEGHLLENRTMVCPNDPEEDVLYYLPSGRILRVKDFRSASANANPNISRQSGDEQDRAVGEDAMLEVIVYRPAKR